MKEDGARAALRAAAAGDESELGDLSTWLAAQDGIVGRYLVCDLQDAARTAATPVRDGGLGQLLNELRNRSDSVLAAFFPGSSASELFELPGALIGPAEALAARAPSEQALSAWPEDATTLAILTRHSSQGRLGAIRTAAWLQTVLGAIGLATYDRFQTITPLAPSASLGTAMFLSTANGEPQRVDRVALLAPGPPPTTGLSDLMAGDASRELVLDATARAPEDLVQQRLTLAARWLQLAASAISTADALVALGIALETIAGDDTKGAVVERVTKRAAVFLASGAPPDERGDIYFEELKHAKKLYELRSRAAHGQYDEWAADQAKDDASREEFHRFVFDVALGFRQHARAHNMGDLEDFKAWWKRAELDGYFA